MASIYDDIKTATELVHEVMASGMSTKDEDLVRVQDILGRSTIAELDTLANDIGRNDEHGNPDPKGAWSSNRRPTRDTFYSIIFKVWNYEEAVQFWNSHTNPEHKELAEMRQSFKTITKQNVDLKAQVAELTARTENAIIEADDFSFVDAALIDKLDSISATIADAAAKIVEYATDTDSDEFHEAVAMHRNAKADYEVYTGVKERIEQLFDYLQRVQLYSDELSEIPKEEMHRICLF